MYHLVIVYLYPRCGFKLPFAFGLLDLLPGGCTIRLPICVRSQDKSAARV